MGRSGFIQPLAYAINSGNVSAARDWLNNYTDDDGTVPVALQGLHSLLLTAENTGKEIDPAALKGAMITSLAMGWNQVSMAQHDGDEYNNQQYLFADVLELWYMMHLTTKKMGCSRRRSNDCYYLANIRY